MDSGQEFDRLKKKYESVFGFMEQHRVSLGRMQIVDHKLAIQGAAPSAEAKRKILDQIRQVDPDWERDVTIDIRTEEDQPPAPNTGQSVVNSSRELSNPGVKHES